MVPNTGAQEYKHLKFNGGSSKSVVKEATKSPKEVISYWWIKLQSGRFLLLLSRFHRCGDDYRRKDKLRTGVFGFTARIMDRVGLGQLKNVRLIVILLGFFNLGVLASGVLVAVEALHSGCPSHVTLGAALMVWAAGMRILWMIGMGFAQANTASTMIAVEEDPTSSNSSHANRGSSFTKRERRMWYRRWLWWSRFGVTMTVLQVCSTAYLVLVLGRILSFQDHHITFCSKEDGHVQQKWLLELMVVLPTLGGVIVVAQCCVGSDVLSWRLLYGAHYGAWRAHYRQMFDYGIREVLCCLGRRRYMTVLEEDEVHSVAALLGDLVAYRAAGASHLEVLAGVALLREGASKATQEDQFPPPPESLICEATILHPYAVAAYTGPLLDVGRNPLTFPCAWLYRQGFLTPWKRSRMPKLEGDNWWRGHAAAFLRFAQLSPEALRQGRVLQTGKRESVYFVVVLHHLRSVVVAVRGTETPEDLLTDGLGRESALLESDLHGILKNSTISERVKQEVLETMPHFGHLGVIEAGRELASQLDNLSDDDEVVHGKALTASRGNGTMTGDKIWKQWDEFSHLNFQGAWLRTAFCMLVVIKGSCSTTGCLHKKVYRKSSSASENGCLFSFSSNLPIDGCESSLLGKKKGLLSSLLGHGCECEGYSLRIVGHSLGGAIAALTGLRLASRYPNLHVYTFGVLPCVDLITAEASSSFITSVIYNDEFSSRISVAAIMRLRAAALQALASDVNTDSDLVTRLTRRLFKFSSDRDLNGQKSDKSQRRRRRVSNSIKGGAFLCAQVCQCVVQMPKYSATLPLQSVQLANFVQTFDGESIEEHTLIQKSQFSIKDTSRDSLGARENCDDGIFDTSSRDRVDHNCATLLLSDGEAVVLDAGSEILDNEEAVDLVSDSGTGRQGHEREEPKDIQGSLDLLDNGMPRDLVGFPPGVDLQELWPAEMYVPGLVIHLVRNTGNSSWSDLRKSFSLARHPNIPKRPKHKAFLKDRKHFRDILVSPAMFLDHMPWKCQYALNDILEQLHAARQTHVSSSSEISIV